MQKFLPTLWAYNQTRDMDDMDQDHTELYIELAETAKEHTDDLLDRDLWLSSQHIRRQWPCLAPDRWSRSLNMAPKKDR